MCAHTIKYKLKQLSLCVCILVHKFQKFSGIDVDGAVGPITKALLLASRFDSLKDLDNSEEEGNNMFEFNSDVRNITPPNNETIVKFSVGIVPGYLNQSEVEAEIINVLMQWGYATGLEFLLASEGEEAMIKIKFDEPSDMDQNIFRFDGPGGCIAHADVENKTILLDSSERWFVNPTNTDDATIVHGNSVDSHFNIGTVVFHEFGHILGLRAHSPHAEDVMSPFYVASTSSPMLGPSDSQRVRKLYDNTQEVGLVLQLKRPAAKSS